jgi:hypothetical protein
MSATRGCLVNPPGGGGDWGGGIVGGGGEGAEGGALIVGRLSSVVFVGRWGLGVGRLPIGVAWDLVTGVVTTREPFRSWDVAVRSLTFGVLLLR